MKKGKEPFKKIAGRLTGFSTPIFGISWNPPEDKRAIARQIITFLEDRRALYSGYDSEFGPWVTQSVLEIREKLTELLETCPDEDKLVGPMRSMRAACRKFLDDVNTPKSRGRIWYPREALMWEALGSMRAIFGLHLARLCVSYGIDAESDLASIFPEIDIDEKKEIGKNAIENTKQ